MKRVATVVALLCGLLHLGSAPVGAACLGPSIEYESGAVRRGGTVTVTGSGFGDNCYDTGPPPAGEGYLGKPLTEIEVVLVQSDRQTVVARGAADEGYAFEIDVVVPVGSFPGEARLLALDEATGLTASGDLAVTWTWPRTKKRAGMDRYRRSTGTASSVSSSRTA